MWAYVQLPKNGLRLVEVGKKALFPSGFKREG